MDQRNSKGRGTVTGSQCEMACPLMSVGSCPKLFCCDSMTVGASPMSRNVHAVPESGQSRE